MYICILGYSIGGHGRGRARGKGDGWMICCYVPHTIATLLSWLLSLSLSLSLLLSCYL